MTKIIIEKPIRGIIPRWLWKEIVAEPGYVIPEKDIKDRVTALKEAITRFVEAGKPIPESIFKDYNEMVAYLKNEKQEY